MTIAEAGPVHALTGAGEKDLRDHVAHVDLDRCLVARRDVGFEYYPLSAALHYLLDKQPEASYWHILPPARHAVIMHPLMGPGSAPARSPCAQRRPGTEFGSAMPPELESGVKDNLEVGGKNRWIVISLDTLEQVAYLDIRITVAAVLHFAAPAEQRAGFVEQEDRLSAFREPEHATQIVFGFTDVLAGHGR